VWRICILYNLLNEKLICSIEFGLKDMSTWKRFRMSAANLPSNLSSGRWKLPPVMQFMLLSQIKYDLAAKVSDTTLM